MLEKKFRSSESATGRLVAADLEGRFRLGAACIADWRWNVCHLSCLVSPAAVLCNLRRAATKKDVWPGAADTVQKPL